MNEDLDDGNEGPWSNVARIGKFFQHYKYRSCLFLFTVDFESDVLVY